MDAVEMLLLFDYYGDMLTERQRMCLDLRYNQDLSLAEIAEEFGMKESNVAMLMLRTRLKLKEFLEKEGLYNER